jgi:hypothetical protein
MSNNKEFISYIGKIDGKDFSRLLNEVGPYVDS